MGICFLDADFKELLMKNKNNKSFPLTSILIAIPFILLIVLAVFSITKGGFGVDVANKQDKNDQSAISTNNDGKTSDDSSDKASNGKD